MLSYVRPDDNLWDVPVVVFCVWTVVLVISSMIVLSCLKRETKKFNKRLIRAENKTDLVEDIDQLEVIVSRYVRSKLGQGVLATMANSFDRNRTGPSADIRREIEGWFSEKCAKLRKLGYDEKTINRLILSAIRSGLTKHPMDLRGSRHSLEAARIFLELEKKKGDAVSFLDTKLTFSKSPEPHHADTGPTCPTVACDWIAAKILRLLSLCMSHPHTTPLLFVFLSFTVWAYDTLSDMVIIQKFWSFQIPILYPHDDSTDDLTGDSMTYLSYQTLTIDLYSPLLLMVLVFSIIFTLLSCSCSRLSDKYRIGAEYARQEKEVHGVYKEDVIALLSRYDFNISSAVTSPLPQFTLQFTAYIIILYMLETLKGLSVEQATKEAIADKIQEFSFASLWFSGVGSALSLIVAQYSALKIQHEHCLTLRQRCIYLLACVFNTIAMMSSSLMLILLILLPAATYVGRYHIMVIIILGATILGIGILISGVLASFGLDPTKLETDRVITVFDSDSLLTAFIRFSQTGGGQWRTVLGGTTLIGRLFSLCTVNLFLPPSQLLVHPFLKFYSTSPRSPALHYAVAKQIVYYNILTIISSILLCVDINIYGFNYGLTPQTKNLLIYVNVCGVPFLFLAYFLLFKFYSSYDLWTSNGVHLVYLQEGKTIIHKDEESYGATILQETERTLLADGEANQTEESVGEMTRDLSHDNIENSESYGEEYPDKVVNESELNSPEAESTRLGVVANGNTEDGEDHNESTEADRGQIKQKFRKVILQKQKAKLSRRLVKSKHCLLDCITDVSIVDTRGRWLDVSDLPHNV